MLRHPDYRARITYLVGSPLNHIDLERANCHQANAIFLLSSSHVLATQTTPSSDSAEPSTVQSPDTDDVEYNQSKNNDAEICTMILAVKVFNFNSRMDIRVYQHLLKFIIASPKIYLFLVVLIELYASRN